MRDPKGWLEATHARQLAWLTRISAFAGDAIAIRPIASTAQVHRRDYACRYFRSIVALEFARRGAVVEDVDLSRYGIGRGHPTAARERAMCMSASEPPILRCFQPYNQQQAPDGTH